MINTKKTGAFISKLRKDHDLTQLELAETLHVSHQAISKWERGESMPDIQTIPEIAKFFTITVDELLKGEHVLEQTSTNVKNEGAIIEHFSKGDVKKVGALINDEVISMDQIANVAPMIKTSQMDSLVHELDQSFSIGDIVALAPFISDSALSKIVNVILNKGSNQVHTDHIVSLAPFLSKETLNLLVKKVKEAKLDSQIILSLAPFLDHDTLEELVNSILDESLTGITLPGLAPFLSNKALKNIVNQMNTESLDQNTIISLVPFLDNDTLDTLVDSMIVRGSVSELTAIAPFLTEDTLLKILSEIGNKNLSTDLLHQLAPFISKDLLSELVENFIN